MAGAEQLKVISLQPNQMLVEPEWLNENLDAHNLRLFETTGKINYDSKLEKFIPSNNIARFNEEHIPGANYLDLYEELSNRSLSEMYPMPTVQQFEDVMSNRGVEPGTVVVLYSAVRPSWATRVWWMLKYHGFDDVVVLNGGWEQWQKRGFPIHRTVRTYPKSTFKAHLRPELLVQKNDVIKAMDDSNVVLINALSKAQFDGSDSIHYGRPGHIPTSKNLPYLDFLQEDLATFRSPAEIRAMIFGFSQQKKIIAYCGGGIGATAIAFAFELANHLPIAVYSGSMEQWANDRSLPVSTTST